MGQQRWPGVFGSASHFWDYVECLDMSETWISYSNSSSAVGEEGTMIKSTFRFWHQTYSDSDLLNHYKRSVTEMKDYINESPTGTFGRLLDDVPERPSASEGRPLAASKRYEFLGLLAKYNLEYRRPYPQERNAMSLDRWHKMDLGRPLAAWAKTSIEKMMAPYFRVPEYPQTLAWWDVDWDAEITSMMVPLKSAVGDPPCALFREVLGTNFPCFSYINRKDFTAAQIEEAWVQLPVLRRGKMNRGTNAGRQQGDRGRWREDWGGRWRDEGGRWREGGGGWSSGGSRAK